MPAARFTGKAQMKQEFCFLKGAQQAAQLPAGVSQQGSDQQRKTAFRFTGISMNMNGFAQMNSTCEQSCLRTRNPCTSLVFPHVLVLHFFFCIH